MMIAEDKIMFTYLRKAQYHETDKMGFVHHSNYIKWMEEARVAFMDELGFSYHALEDLGIVSPVTGISIEYKKSTDFDDLIEIRVSVLRYTGVRLEISYEMINKETGEICTSAVSSHCFLKDGRVVSLKRVLPELDKIIRDSMGENDF